MPMPTPCHVMPCHAMSGHVKAMRGHCHMESSFEPGPDKSELDLDVCKPGPDGLGPGPDRPCKRLRLHPGVPPLPSPSPAHDDCFDPSEYDQESESSQAAKPPTSTNSTKEVNLTPWTCNAAQGQAQNGKRLTKYAINGMDPDRIQLCLAADKRICGPTCRKSCGSQFTAKEVQAVCNVCPP